MSVGKNLVTRPGLICLNEPTHEIWVKISQRRAPLTGSPKTSLSASSQYNSRCGIKRETKRLAPE